VESFETFFEKNIATMPFTRGTVAYSTGVFIPEEYWNNFSTFPSLFEDKLNIVCKGLDDQRKRDVNRELIGKCISLAAAFIGYGSIGQGYKMPKTKVICDYRGLNEYLVDIDVGETYVLQKRISAVDEEGAKKVAELYGPVEKIEKEDNAIAQHTHFRNRSWSHNIEIFFSQIIDEENPFDVLMGTIIHEMIHAKQTTTRRLSTSSNLGAFKWDGKVHEPGNTHAEYKATPWEQEAYGKTPELLEQIYSFLRTGAVKGFNPKRI
jgi:hypothetical protein